MTTTTTQSQSQTQTSTSTISNIDPAVLATFNCPISYDIMDDPVICADGHTYNRSSIEHWIRLGNNLSPLTGLPLDNLQLIPNIALRNVIYQYFPNLSTSSSSTDSRTTSSISARNTSPPQSPQTPISRYLLYPHDDNSSNNWLHPNNIRPRRSFSRNTRVRPFPNLNYNINRNDNNDDNDNNNYNENQINIFLNNLIELRNNIYNSRNNNNFVLNSSVLQNHLNDIYQLINDLNVRQTNQHSNILS